MTNNLFCRNGSTLSNIIDWSGSNQIASDWIITDAQYAGVSFAGYNNYLTDFSITGCNKVNTTQASGMIIGGANGSNTFDNLDIQSNRIAGILVNQATSNMLFNSSTIGNRYTNVLDLSFATDILVTMVFRSGLFGSATLASGYTNLFSGSRIGFHRYQNTDRRHFSYTPTGDITSTGSSLADTTADTTFDTTSLAMKLTPNSLTNTLTQEFSMPQRAGNTIIFNGKLYKDASFNGTCVVNLYLDGSVTPDAAYTLSGAVSTWIPFVISADYTSGTIDRNATIRVVATGTAGNVYLDTLFNSSKTTNPIGSLDLWQDGIPNEYLVSTVASSSEIAGAVWADTVEYTGTQKGKVLQDGADSAELASIK